MGDLSGDALGDGLGNATGQLRGCWEGLFEGMLCDGPGNAAGLLWGTFDVVGVLQRCLEERFGGVLGCLVGFMGVVLPSK